MLFSSTIFLFIFIPVVIFFYYVVFSKSRKWQNITLCLLSLFFYAWGEPLFVFIMITSIIFNWGLGILIDKYRDNKGVSRLVLFIMLAFNISYFFVFKYLMFTLENINYIMGSSISIPHIALPIGISFFTFQAMSYVIDVYRKNGEVQKNILNVALYISFFPQLIAGPIVRYSTIAEQISNRKETLDGFTSGVQRFIIGLGKKVLIANTMALIADAAFSTDLVGGEKISVMFSILGALAYTFQIFYDFSGYSDMAIGLGKMFGFNFLENFNYPYISKSITEFWRRWHISLGTWFRDYVYIPLGGSRVKTKLRLVFNLFVVWLLTGLWHGANWTFILWGLLYFMLLTFEKIIDYNKITKKLSVLRNIYTLFFVIIGWVLFRSDSIQYAFLYLQSMFGLSENAFMDNYFIGHLSNSYIFFILGFIFSMPVKILFKRIINVDNLICNIAYNIILIIIFIISISYIVKGSYNPFIYFNF